jgi:arabinose-5-phosphate isomerase
MLSNIDFTGLDSDDSGSKQILKEAARILKIESQALEMAGKGLDSQFVNAVKLLQGASGRVIVTGVGKSGIIAQKIASTMRSLGISSVFMHPVEAFHGDLGLVLKDDVVIMLSNSGETSEMINLVPYIKRQGSSVIAMTGKKDSTLSNIADVSIDSAIEKEACPLNLAPTASTTVMLGLGDALALILAELKGFTVELYKRFHPGGSLGLKLLKVDEIMIKAPDLPVIDMNTGIIEAVSVISEKGLGVVVICSENNILKGIITDGDVRRHIQKGLDFSQARACDAMTCNPLTVKKTALVEEALSKMENMKITSLVVADEFGVVSGLIHLHQILKTRIV